jgi:PAS domain S-box-containing protein
MHILVVEDDPALAALLEAQLLAAPELDAEVCTVTTLAGAVEVLARERIDCVLHDFDLPDGHADVTLKHLKERFPHIPLVVHSGQVDEDLAITMVGQGAQDFLVKGRADGAWLARALLFAVERQRIDSELRQANERFEQLFELAPIGMALVAPDGRFLRVNHSFCEIVGHPAADLVARSFQDLTHPDDLAADMRLMGRVLADEITTYALHKRYIHADGSEIPVLLSVSLQRAGDGSPLHFISQVQPILGQKP